MTLISRVSARCVLTERRQLSNRLLACSEVHVRDAVSSDGRQQADPVVQATAALQRPDVIAHHVAGHAKQPSEGWLRDVVPPSPRDRECLSGNVVSVRGADVAGGVVEDARHLDSPHPLERQLSLPHIQKAAHNR